MQKNVASKLVVYAFNSTTNLPITGDAANLTAYVSKDFGSVTVLGDTSAAEMDATNAKGYYLFDLAQAETNADTLLFSAKSATVNIVVLAVPACVFTTILQTGDSFARLGTAGAGLTDLGGMSTTMKAQVEAEVDDALGGGTGTALTAIPWNAAWDAEVQSECADALNAYDPPTSAEMDARTIVSANYATAASLASVVGFVDTEIATLQTSVDDLPTNAELATALGAADDAVLAQVAFVKAKTDNLPTDPADQSLIIDATNALAVLIDALPTNAELATALSTADDSLLAQVALVKVKTDLIPLSPAAVGSVMTLDLTQAFTPTTTTETVGGALAAARAQGFGRWSLVGTTLTLYAADGTTAVRTFTLDSATAPTSRV